MPEWLHHGGGLDAAAARYGIPLDRWLDLSTGINPRPYPLPDLDTTLWHRLPGPDLDKKLREAAATYYGAPGPETVVPVPGTQSLIQWLPRLRPPAKVAVLSPTYGEHAACWRQAGHAVCEIGTLQDLEADCQVLVAVNPNNPDGRVLPPADLLAARDRLTGKDRLLIVDEAFADVTPDCSLGARTAEDGLIVLRSFGKFFGLAGLRLGFALTDRHTAARLDRHFGPWAVSGPAAAIGGQALADAAWITQTRDRLAGDSQRLDQILTAAGLSVVGGTSLFRLVEHAEAAAVFDRLAEAAILIRQFPERPNWLRFGVPGAAEDFQRLKEALAG